MVRGFRWLRPTPGMPRKLRTEHEGAVHHVFARGNNRETVYFAPDDRTLYLKLLEAVVIDREWGLLAYCLMGNHLHLLVQTPEPNLAAGMQWLHGRYGTAFNARYGRSGRVFEDRYGAVYVR